VGITLVGTLAGVFSGATLAEWLDAWLAGMGVVEPYSEAIAVGVVVVGIALATLVLGELVPKRLALHRPELLASWLAGPMRILAWLTMPAVWILSWATGLVTRLLGVEPSNEPPVTQEEIQVLMEQGAEAGVFEGGEPKLVRRIFDLGDRRANTLMTPRHEVVWIDVADTADEVRAKIASSPHARFPVCDGSLDQILGIVQVKDLLIQGLAGRHFEWKGLLMMPQFIYEGTKGLKILDDFKNSKVHVAIVLDEYGSVQGLLTMTDLLEAIVGDLSDPSEEEEPRAVQRPDGSWLLDGQLTREEFAELWPETPLPEADFHTLAGFVIQSLGRIPLIADRFEWSGLSFEVVDMDGKRVDRVLVRPQTSGE
jgi:putative hemolysin